MAYVLYIYLLKPNTIGQHDNFIPQAVKLAVKKNKICRPTLVLTMLTDLDIAPPHSLEDLTNTPVPDTTEYTMLPQHDVTTPPGNTSTHKCVHQPRCT